VICFITGHRMNNPCQFRSWGTVIVGTRTPSPRKS